MRVCMPSEFHRHDVSPRPSADVVRPSRAHQGRLQVFLDRRGQVGHLVRRATRRVGRTSMSGREVLVVVRLMTACRRIGVPMSRSQDAPDTRARVADRTRHNRSTTSRVLRVLRSSPRRLRRGLAAGLSPDSLMSKRCACAPGVRRSCRGVYPEM